MFSARPLRFLVAGAAAVVIAIGAYAIGDATSSQGMSGSADAAQSNPVTRAPRGDQPPPNGQAPPGCGTPVTGATADKVKAAALAKYKGTVERVVKLPDGSYAAHVVTSSGEYHVHVSKDFKVTGVDRGGPPGHPPHAATGGS